MEKVRVERPSSAGGRIAVITLNRPDKRNAVDADVLRLLQRHLAELAQDGELHSVILTGEGSTFSAGADVSVLKGLGPVEADRFMRAGQAVATVIEEFPLPVVAAISGYALGGGLELALACDIRIAARAAKLGQPEIVLGSLPGWGGTQRLVRAVGEARALEMILTGRLIDAAEALAFGLVHRVADEDPLASALELCQGFNDRSPVALGLAKRAVRAARGPTELGLEVERLAVAVTFATPERAEAERRFLDRRKGASARA